MHSVCCIAGVFLALFTQSLSLFSSCSVTFSGRVQVNRLEYQPVNVEIRSPNGESRLTPEPAHRPSGGGPSLVWALAKSFGGTFLIAGFFKLGQDLIVFASPQILK